MSAPRPSQRAGFTWMDLLVVVVLLLIAGMVVPPLFMQDRSHGRLQTCGNNQRQIVLAMNVYANDSDQLWPVYPVDRRGILVSAGDPAMDAVATAIASCEFLSSISGGDPGARTFACVERPQVGPASKAGDFGESGPHYSAWGADGPLRFGFSYDWSAPATSTSGRVLTADRHRTAHGGAFVYAAFADGHAGQIKRIGPSFFNSSAQDDDIYSATGDGPMDVPGSGSTTRAFVR